MLEEINLLSILLHKLLYIKHKFKISIFGYIELIEQPTNQKSQCSIGYFKLLKLMFSFEPYLLLILVALVMIPTDVRIFHFKKNLSTVFP